MTLIHQHSNVVDSRPVVRGQRGRLNITGAALSFMEARAHAEHIRALCDGMPAMSNMRYTGRCAMSERVPPLVAQAVHTYYAAT